VPGGSFGAVIVGPAHQLVPDPTDIKLEHRLDLLNRQAAAVQRQLDSHRAAAGERWSKLTGRDAVSAAEKPDYEAVIVKRVRGQATAGGKQVEVGDKVTWRLEVQQGSELDLGFSGDNRVRTYVGPQTVFVPKINDLRQYLNARY